MILAGDLQLRSHAQKCPSIMRHALYSCGDICGAGEANNVQRARAAESKKIVMRTDRETSSINCHACTCLYSVCPASGELDVE